jgi:hypothetical protein
MKEYSIHHFCLWRDFHAFRCINPICILFTSSNCSLFINNSFLAHLAKDNVSFCHHLASDVCRPSSVNFSHFNLLLWNRLAKWIKTWYEASLECSLWRLRIWVRSANKHARHRPFLLLIGWFLKNLLLWNHFPKWTEIW